MKYLRQLCAGILLIVALSVPAFAGDIQCGATDGPQESPGIRGEMSTPGITGDMGTPGLTGDILTPGFSLFLATFF